jgi:DNA-binding GntR family transcriptional regulator
MIGQLAEHFDVSSTPVRETLIRLHAEGFLDSTSRRGFFAKTLNLKEMADPFELRFSLLRASIERATEATQSNLALALRDVISLTSGDVAVAETPGTDRLVPDNLEEGVGRDERVSQAIVSFSQNKIFVDAINNVNDRTHYVRRISFESPKRRDESRRVIRALSLSMERQDLASAALLLKRDFYGQMEELPSIIIQGISRAYTNPSWVLDFQTQGNAQFSSARSRRGAGVPSEFEPAWMAPR